MTDPHDSGRVQVRADAAQLGGQDRADGSGVRAPVGVAACALVHGADVEAGRAADAAQRLTAERMNPYTSMWTGVTPGDGPQAFHLILLDNGRTDVLLDPTGRQALRCIRCSACSPRRARWCWLP